LREQLSAAAMRDTLIIIGVMLAFEKPWSNNREAQRISNAPWMTARSRGRWLVSVILFVPGMNIISVSPDPTPWVELGMMVVSGPLPPLRFWEFAALPTDVRLPELMFDGKIAPGVVISSLDDFYETDYELK